MREECDLREGGSEDGEGGKGREEGGMRGERGRGWEVDDGREGGGF